MVFDTGELIDRQTDRQTDIYRHTDTLIAILSTYPNRESSNYLVKSHANQATIFVCVYRIDCSGLFMATDILQDNSTLLYKVLQVLISS